MQLRLHPRPPIFCFYGILNRGWVGNTAAEAGNNGEELENKNRGFYLPKDYIRMGILRDGKKLFPFLLSWSKMMLSWGKVHWVFFSNEEQMSWGRVEFFCPEGRRVSSKSPEGQKISTLPKDICSSERKKLNGLSLRTTSFCWRIKEMEESFLPSRSSSSLDNLEANNSNCFYFSILSIIYQH